MLPTLALGCEDTRSTSQITFTLVLLYTILTDFKTVICSIKKNCCDLRDKVLQNEELFLVSKSNRKGEEWVL